MKVFLLTAQHLLEIDNWSSVVRRILDELEMEKRTQRLVYRGERLKQSRDRLEPVDSARLWWLRQRWRSGRDRRRHSDGH